jgi:hypothetical protein
MNEFGIIWHILKKNRDCHLIDGGSDGKLIELHCGADQASLVFDASGRFIGVGE